MSNRQIQLAFDGEKYRKVQIKTGIPQGSPVSPILFLIYISFLFKNEADNIYIKFLSYLDDIAIITSGESAQENCQILKATALNLMQWGKENTIDFDSEKTELIHFQNKRDPEVAELQLNESLTIKPKNDVKWLGIWFNRKLNFKNHVEKRLALANRCFHQISRLSNCEKGLSIQAMRQLYIACITSIADYGIPIWWNKQKELLSRFQQLQNSMLRKILGAFKTSPIAAMEIEASVIPVNIRFEKACKSYAFRAIQMNINHPIQMRTTNSFPPQKNRMEIDIDWDRYLDWNQNDPLNIKRYPSQLFRILNSIADTIPSLNIEEIDQINQKPWQVNSISFQILNKEEAASIHQLKIQELLNKRNYIIYTDGSKLENKSIGIGVYLIDNHYQLNDQQRIYEYSWYLGKNIEIFDAELLAIQKALELAADAIIRKKENIKDIYIFTDS